MVVATFCLAVFSLLIAALALYVSWFDPSHRAKVQRRDEALERITKFANLCRKTQPVGVGNSRTFAPELRKILEEDGNPIGYSDAHLLRRNIVESADGLYTLTKMAWASYSEYPGAITRYDALFGDLPCSTLAEVDKEEHTSLRLARLLRGRKAANQKRNHFRLRVHALLNTRTWNVDHGNYFAPNAQVPEERFKELATLVGIGTAAQSAFESLSALPDDV